jgi:hypothetical protein
MAVLPDQVQDGPHPLVFHPESVPNECNPNSFSSGRRTAVPEVAEYVVFVLTIIFSCHFLPKNRMSSPKNT